jgi:hypothetical protein
MSAVAPSCEGEGEDRQLHLKLGRCFTYYCVDLFSFLGPLHGYIIAPLVWGQAGAQSMQYWPLTLRSAAVKWLFIWPIECMLFKLPLLEAALVLAGVRDSSFDPAAQGLLPLLYFLTVGLPSAFKYGFMNSRRFHTAVLKRTRNTADATSSSPTLAAGTVPTALRRSSSSTEFSRGDHLDSTVDRINTWTRALEPEVVERQLNLALWRTGNARDGDTMRFELVGGASASLGEVLRGSVARHADAEEFRAIRQRLVLAALVFVPISCIPNIHRAVTHGATSGVGFWRNGDDGGSLSLLVDVCTIICTAVVLDYNVMWGVNKTRGHLSRARAIEAEWSRVLLQLLEQRRHAHADVRGVAAGGAGDGVTDGADGGSGGKDSPTKLAATGANVRRLMTGLLPALSE